MEEVKIIISDVANLEFIVYDNNQKGAYLNYVEHSTDSWPSDSETSTELNNGKLDKIYKAIGKYLGK